jgi:hypothetical protein
MGPYANLAGGKLRLRLRLGLRLGLASCTLGWVERTRVIGSNDGEERWKTWRLVDKLHALALGSQLVLSQFVLELLLDKVRRAPVRIE